METLKLPRKLKKELKKAVMASIPDNTWKSNEIKIYGYKSVYRHMAKLPKILSQMRRPISLKTHKVVTSFTLGY